MIIQSSKVEACIVIITLIHYRSLPEILCNVKKVIYIYIYINMMTVVTFIYEWTVAVGTFKVVLVGTT